jgi:hypothetical protein
MQELKTLSAESHKSLVDFDQWASLAKTDLAAFEAKRSEVIEDLIQSMPPHKQQRMRCLQWKIDQVRKQASNPMAACVKLSEMMWDSVVGPGGLREALERVGDGKFQPPPKACVLEIRPLR